MVQGVPQRSNIADLLGGAPAQFGGFGRQAPTSLGSALDPLIEEISPQQEPADVGPLEGAATPPNPFDRSDLLKEYKDGIFDIDRQLAGIEAVRASGKFDPLDINRTYGVQERTLRAERRALNKAMLDQTAQDRRDFAKHQQTLAAEKRKAARNPNPRLGPLANKLYGRQFTNLEHRASMKNIDKLVSSSSVRGIFGAFSTIGDAVGAIQRGASRIRGRDVSSADRRNIIRLKNELEKIQLAEINRETGASRSFLEMKRLAKVFASGNMSWPVFKAAWDRARSSLRREMKLITKTLDDDRLPSTEEADLILGDEPDVVEQPADPAGGAQTFISPFGTREFGPQTGGGESVEGGNPKFKGVSTEEIRRRLNAL